jgi:hypothetical protein
MYGIPEIGYTRETYSLMVKNAGNIPGMNWVTS